MASKNILVTGIGGNVGQGILRNLLNSKYNLRLIGTNVDKISTGNHLCDAVYELPFAYDPGYINEMKGVCDAENVDLIIPSTDFESHYLSKHPNSLPKIAVCPSETVATFIDKLETFRYLANFNIPFAKSCLPSEYNFDYKECIAKPRKGRGSRGLVFNPKSVEDSMMTNI